MGLPGASADAGPAHRRRPLAAHRAGAHRGLLPGGVSGRASAIAVNPENFGQVFLGTASGGVWYSPNGGLEWTPISDDEGSLAIGAIVPAECTVMECSKLYVGTGENAIRRDTYYGRGLLIGTLDSGTWNWVTRGTSPPHDFRGASIIDVVRAPASTAPIPRLFLAVSSGVLTSSAQATVTVESSDLDTYGIYRSVNDGLTWQRLPVAGVGGGLPTDLEMNPALPSVLYAGFLGRGLFRSVNDGDDWCPLTTDGPTIIGCPAVSWSPIAPAGYDHVEIAMATGSIMYASFGFCPDSLFANCIPSVYRSDDGGASWTLTFDGNCNSGPYLDGVPRGYSRYTHLLAVSPHDPEEVWLGGIKLWRSLDGGQMFAPADINALDEPPRTEIIHLDHHEIVFHPTIPGRAYETSDGGVAVLEGDLWTPRNQGLQITGFQGIAASNLTLRVIGGAQDNSGGLWRGTDVWDSFETGGDGGNVVIDSSNPDVMYLGTNYGSVLGSLDGGDKWCMLKNGIIDTSEPKAFYAPIVQGPSPDRTVYTASNRLYKGVRTGDRCREHPLISFMDFTPISPALAPDDLGSEAEEICRKRVAGLCAVDCDGENVITAIGVAPGDADRVFIGYYGGQIFVTSDASMAMPTWGEITSTLPARPITRIAVHPTDPNTLLVSHLGFIAGSANLWRGVVAGSAITWTASDNGLPGRVAVNTVHYEPGFPDIVWAGLDGNETTDSVYRSSDGGLTWSAHSAGLPNVPVFEIAFDSVRRWAYAGTHGRGAWALGGARLIPWESWRAGERLDVPVFGQLFTPGVVPMSCQIELFTVAGQLCASSATDAVGANLLANPQGQVRADLGGIESPVVWACKNGMCAGGIPISACGSAQDPLQRVEIRCGSELAVASLIGPGVVTSPPSSALSLDLGASQGPGVATLLLALHAGDGQSGPLCSVPLELDPGQDSLVLMEAVAKAMEKDSNCAALGIFPSIQFNPGSEIEDDFAREPSLSVEAPTLVGTQVVTGVAVAPGAAVGACLQVGDLGQATAGQLVPTALGLTTALSGAAGGSLRVSLRSPVGECRLEIPTAPGDSAAAIATALAAALAQGGGNACPAEQLARDAVAVQDKVRLPLALSIRVCVDDPGVGFMIQSEDILNNHPIAAVSAQVNLNCAVPGAATVVLDGLSSSDADSTPGTTDDIVQYDWYLDFGQPTQTLLGTGASIQVVLSFPSASITLVVADAGGLTSSRTVTVDTTGGAADTDLDGYPDPCDNCLEIQNDQADADQDGHGDACDCAFQDPTTQEPPVIIDSIVWQGINGDPGAAVSWTSLLETSGSSVVYDLISGKTSGLGLGPVLLDECLAVGQSANQAMVQQPQLAPVEIYWYLVSGRNSCGGDLWDSGGPAQDQPRQPGSCVP